MSKYTTQIRWIVEQAEKDAMGRYTPGVYTDASYKALGMDTYPIFDESYRHLLNDKIIGHYYFNEIGFETAAQFAWFMRQKLLEIMPYYNQLYDSLGKVENPLTDTELGYTEGWGVDTSSTNQSDYQASTNTDSRNVFSDTPMSMLRNDGSPSVENLDYATTVTYDDTNTSDKSESNASNKGLETGSRERAEKGRHRSESDLLKEWRSTFINVDAMIIDDLKDLFMGVW